MNLLFLQLKQRMHSQQEMPISRPCIKRVKNHYSRSQSYEFIFLLLYCLEFGPCLFFSLGLFAAPKIKYGRNFSNQRTPNPIRLFTVCSTNWNVNGNNIITIYKYHKRGNFLTVVKPPDIGLKREEDTFKFPRTFWKSVEPSKRAFRSPRSQLLHCAGAVHVGPSFWWSITFLVTPDPLPRWEHPNAVPNMWYPIVGSTRWR